MLDRNETIGSGDLVGVCIMTQWARGRGAGGLVVQRDSLALGLPLEGAADRVGSRTYE
jgi:hypothetical protein